MIKLQIRTEENLGVIITDGELKGTTYFFEEIELEDGSWVDALVDENSDIQFIIKNTEIIESRNDYSIDKGILTVEKYEQ